MIAGWYKNKTSGDKARRFYIELIYSRIINTYIAGAFVMKSQIAAWSYMFYNSLLIYFE